MCSSKTVLMGAFAALLLFPLPSDLAAQCCLGKRRCRPVNCCSQPVCQTTPCVPQPFACGCMGTQYPPATYAPPYGTPLLQDTGYCPFCGMANHGCFDDSCHHDEDKDVLEDCKSEGAPGSQAFNDCYQRKVGSRSCGDKANFIPHPCETCCRNITTDRVAYADCVDKCYCGKGPCCYYGGGGPDCLQNSMYPCPPRCRPMPCCPPRYCPPRRCRPRCRLFRRCR